MELPNYLRWPKQRAWGWYATLLRTPWFCVKILRFKPDGKLSIQKHKYRTEIWMTLKGEGILKCNEDLFFTYFGRVKVIRPNTWHTFRAAHPRDKPVYILEVQYGKKVTETDIERR